MRQIRGIPGSGKFRIDRFKIDYDINMAIRTRKLQPENGDKVHEVASQYFPYVKLNQVMLQSVECPSCRVETVTIPLSHKFGEFEKRTFMLPHEEQVALFNSWFSSSSGCPSCGAENDASAIFCSNCGTKIA